MQVYFKGTNAKITGFDNINAISKYKLHIDSVGYSMAKIANVAVEIIKENKKRKYNSGVFSDRKLNVSCTFPVLLHA